MTKTFRKIEFPRPERETELLNFLRGRFQEWLGKPAVYKNGESFDRDFSDVQQKIQELSDSYSSDFVVLLFAEMEIAARLNVDYAARYGRFYNDPDSSLEDLEYGQAKEGHRKILKIDKPNKVFVPKDKSAFNVHREWWRKWQEKPELFKNVTAYYRKMEQETGTTERAVREHVKIFKKNTGSI